MKVCPFYFPLIYQIDLNGILQVKLPADAEDRMKRPAYIKTSNAGVAICDNRLEVHNVFLPWLTVRRSDCSTLFRKGPFCVKGMGNVEFLFARLIHTKIANASLRLSGMLL
jgi:hypothetical protein